MALNHPSRRALLVGSVVAVGSASAYHLTRSDAEPAPGVSPSFHASDETSALGVDLAGKPIQGSPDAPVEIYYWTDFQCPFCEQFERETLPYVVRDHVEPGRVRIVLVPVAFFGADSMTAAVASRCAWEQVRESEPETYWSWHTAVLEEQGEKNSGWASAATLLEITRSVAGVDADAMGTCLDERRSAYEEEISADGELASSFGITNTPTFVVFDPASETADTLVGAQPPKRFDDAIERIRGA